MTTHNSVPIHAASHLDHFIRMPMHHCSTLLTQLMTTNGSIKSRNFRHSDLKFLKHLVWDLNIPNAYCVVPAVSSMQINIMIDVKHISALYTLTVHCSPATRETHDRDIIQRRKLRIPLYHTKGNRRRTSAIDRQPMGNTVYILGSCGSPLKVVHEGTT